jgi:hypothetical protein
MARDDGKWLRSTDEGQQDKRADSRCGAQKGRFRLLYIMYIIGVRGEGL